MSFCIYADLSSYFLHRRLPCMFLTLIIPFSASQFLILHAKKSLIF